MKLGRFFQYVYVKVDINKFTLRHINSGQEFEAFAEEPFTTNRLLVGNFAVAETLLTKSLKQLFKAKLFTPSPYMVIHPLAMTDGGLCEVEDRAIRELAAGAGASKIKLWVGNELSDEEVVELLKNQ